MEPTTSSTTEIRDLPDGRLVYDIGDGARVLRDEFQPAGVYLDSPTYGLPPKVALDALSGVTADWVSGRYDPVSCDQAVARARSTFAGLHSVSAADVAIGHQVSPMVGLVAASLPPRARVLAVEGDFTRGKLKAALANQDPDGETKPDPQPELAVANALIAPPPKAPVARGPSGRRRSRGS